MSALLKPTKRIFLYIDGLNLFYALNKKNWEELNWLDIVKFCEKNIPDSIDYSEVFVKYYTSKFDRHTRNGKAQLAFIEANELINSKTNKLQIIRGVHKMGTIMCDTCKEETPKMFEKKTDVNIALDMVEDAVIKGYCDISVLMSNDTDLVPSIKMIKNHKPKHRILILVPPTDTINYELQHAAGSRTDEHVIVFLKKEYSKYKDSSLEESIIFNSTKTIIRPDIYNKEFIIEEKRKEKEKNKEALKAAKSDYKKHDELEVVGLDKLKEKFSKK